MPQVSPLRPEQCRRVSDTAVFNFSSTAELPPSAHIIGQPRGTRAIAFGIGIQSHGYNIFVLGEAGTGRATAIQHFLQEQTRNRPTPEDWVYVHNFATPHQPRAISLPPGEGEKFATRMSKLIADLRRDLPQAFDSETYQTSIQALQETFEEQENQLLKELSEQAKANGFALVRTPSSFAIIPARNGRQLTPEELQEQLNQMTATEQEALQTTHEQLTIALQEIMGQLHQLELGVRQQMKEIDRTVAANAVQRYFDDIKALYQNDAEMMVYLEEVQQDVIMQVDDFAPPVDSENTEEIDLRRYQVNLLIDNQSSTGAPVIYEGNPTFTSLFGRIEYESQAGYIYTHFTNIKCGSLHKANGGYLIININDLLKNQGVWEGLKRVLKEERAFIQSPTAFDQGQIMAKSLDPEPIPLDVKIILLGNLPLYYALYDGDEDFSSLFKVRADFDTTMPRDDEHTLAYAQFIATRCHEEKLRHFEPTAVAKVVEYGSRLADHQNKLSTRFGDIADLIREASYWAGVNGRTAVSAADVVQALAERNERVNRAEEHIFETLLDGTIFVATSGQVIGQVNGLSVLDTGDYAFGQPGRITARTYMGDDGITHIEREIDMSGPIHDKGVLTLLAYLGGTYAQDQPLSLNASITFEQNYGGIDGDSASSTELYALLSSLSGLPIEQGIAVTGSVNQRGDIQPIGGVNEKIEGFFRLCAARGLTGTQGVIIPATNVPQLMLHEDVVTAVAAGTFHIWPISYLDEGIELLMGIPAGELQADGAYPENSVHYLVQNRLLQLAEDLNAFGKDEDGEEEDSVSESE